MQPDPPPTTPKSLANELKKAGPPPKAQTVNVLATKEGAHIVTAGGQPLTAAQKKIVAKRGGTVGPHAKGFDAEPMGLEKAGELGHTPTGGAVTNKMCKHCEAQVSSQAEAGGYKLNLSKDKKSYTFEPPKANVPKPADGKPPAAPPEPPPTPHPQPTAHAATEPVKSPTNTLAAEAGANSTLAKVGVGLAGVGAAISAYGFYQDVSHGNVGGAVVNGAGFASGALIVGGTVASSAALLTAGTVLAIPTTAFALGKGALDAGSSDFSAKAGQWVDGPNTKGPTVLGATVAAGTAIVTSPYFVAKGVFESAKSAGESLGDAVFRWTH